MQGCLAQLRIMGPLSPSATTIVGSLAELTLECSSWCGRSLRDGQRRKGGRGEGWALFKEVARQCSTMHIFDILEHITAVRAHF